MKKIKNIILLLIFFAAGNYSYSQKFETEPGIILGTSYYLGDVNHTRQFYSPGFVFGVILKHPVNDFYALRINALRAKISGSDFDFANNYQQTRGYVFSETLYEVSFQAEINFLSYNSKIRKSNTPYITAGAGFVYSDGGVFTPVLPLGVGYKYSPAKKISLNFEWCFRNTFTDNLDLLEQPYAGQKQITKTKTVDWYSVASLMVTYNLSSDKKWCPAYDKKRKH